MPSHVLAFVVTAWLLAMLPGVGQALILRQTLTRGMGAARASIAGTVSGILVWSTLAVAGLSAVLMANPAAYLALRIGGGLVLGYLGISSLRAVWGTRHSDQRSSLTCPDTEAANGRGAYLAGLATNLGNPKAGVFAVSLIPQFIAPGRYVVASGVLLGMLWAVTTGCWYLLFVRVVDRGRSFVSRPDVTTWLHGITGTVLLMLGIAVIAGV